MIHLVASVALLGPIARFQVRLDAYKGGNLNFSLNHLLLLVLLVMMMIPMKLETKAVALLASRSQGKFGASTLTPGGLRESRSSRDGLPGLRERVESRASFEGGVQRSKSAGALGARPSSAPSFGRGDGRQPTRWHNPINPDDHWSDRLALVPTKSGYTRQQLLMEERKQKFKQKKLLFAMVGKSD